MKRAALIITLAGIVILVLVTTKGGSPIPGLCAILFFIVACELCRKL